MKDNFSISTVAYSGHPIEQALDSIRSLGVVNIELALIQGAVHGLKESDLSEDKVVQISALLKERGMMCTSLAAHCEMKLEDCDALLLKRVELTHLLDCSRLILYAPRDGSLKEFQQNAKRAIAKAEMLGVQILIENVGDQKPYMLNDSRDFVQVREDYLSTALGINFDPGNLASHRPENDLLHDSIRSLDSAEHIHIKDLYQQGEDYLFCAIGEGIGRYAEFLKYAGSKNKMPFFSIEAPFSLVRKGDGSTTLKSLDQIPSISIIENRLQRSVSFIREHL